MTESLVILGVVVILFGVVLRIRAWGEESRERERLALKRSATFYVLNHRQ